MNSIVKPAALLLVLALITSKPFAQEKAKTEGDTDKTESITIRKNGDSNEKLTIVIDGDKVTVNGKPLDDFKSDNVEIIRNEDGNWNFDMVAPPMAFSGPMNNDMPREEFMKEIHSNKAFLGVMTKKTDDGAQVTDVTKESAAEKAGLKEGDVITKVNDDKIADADDLYKAVGNYKPGDKITITYKRDGKEYKATATLDENKQVRIYSWKNDNNNFNFRMPGTPMPEIRGWNGSGDFFERRPRLGLQIQDTEDGKGVKVLDVDDEGSAGKAGVKEDDIITSVNGKAITSVDDMHNIMNDAKPGDTIKITFLRNGKTQTADIKFPKDLKTTDL